MVRNAYLYMRFSSAEQADGDSLRRQRALADEYVSSHPEKQLQIVEDLQFVDEGVSSFSGQNLQPGRQLHKFLKCIEEGIIPPGSVLMVESLDRLSRQQVLEAQKLLLDILLKDVSVITTSPAERREYDRRSGLHDLISSLAGMERANHESELKSDRVRRAWRKKKDNAGTVKLTKRSPAWLSLSNDRKSFSLIDEKVAVVRRVFELSETLGQHSVARVLNQEGVPPFQPKKSGWHASSVKKLLSSPAVIGVYQPHTSHRNGGKRTRVQDGPPIEGYYPPIIDAATFYRMQSLKSERKQTDGGRKGVSYSNILAGIVKCGYCQSSMVVINKGREPKGGSYFVCSAARRGLGCKYRSVRYAACEQGFLRYCQRVDISEILPGGAGKSEATKLRKRQAELLGEASQKRAVVARILSSIERNGGDVPRAIQHQLVEIESRTDAIEKELTVVAAELGHLESESHRVAGMQTMFHELFMQMNKATEQERYVLRSKLNAVLKTAVAKILITEAATKDLEKVKALIASQRAHYTENLGKPGAPDYSAHPEIEAYPRVKGVLTSFRVQYKNGNEYELFIDSVEAIAGRMQYTKAAAAEAKSRGIDVKMMESIRLTHLYGARVRVIPARQSDGKFTRRPSTAAA